MYSLLNWLRPSKHTTVKRSVQPSLEHLGERIVPATFAWYGTTSTAWNNASNWRDNVGGAVTEYPGQNRNTDTVYLDNHATVNCVLPTSMNLTLDTLIADSTFNKVLSLGSNVTATSLGAWNAGDMLFNDTQGGIEISAGHFYFFGGNMGYDSTKTGYTTGYITVDSGAELDLDVGTGVHGFGATIMIYGTVHTAGTMGNYLVASYASQPTPQINTAVNSTWNFDCSTAGAGYLDGGTSHYWFVNSGTVNFTQNSYVGLVFDNAGGNVNVSSGKTVEFAGDDSYTDVHFNTYGHASYVQLPGTATPTTLLAAGSTIKLHNDVVFDAGTLEYDGDSSNSTVSETLSFIEDHGATCNLVFNNTDIAAGAMIGRSAGAATDVVFNSLFIGGLTAGDWVEIHDANVELDFAVVTTAHGSKWSQINMGRATWDDAQTGDQPDIYLAVSGGKPAVTNTTDNTVWVMTASPTYFSMDNGWTGSVSGDYTSITGTATNSGAGFYMTVS